MSACPGNPPPPAGYTVYKGNVPPALSAWAVSLLAQSSHYDLGQTWATGSGGKTIVARLDRHTWHYRPDGTLMTGLCWKGITLYAPLPSGFVGDSLVDVATASPDPAYAVFDAPPSATNWGLVVVSGAALLATVMAFALGLKYAGRA